MGYILIDDDEVGMIVIQLIGSLTHFEHDCGVVVVTKGVDGEL